jgi:hypothetical protein
MTILESLVAAVLFSASAGVSAQILGIASASSVHHGRIEALVDRQEAEMQLIDQQFRRLRQPVPLPQDCGTASEWLRTLIEAMPVAEAISRRIEPSGDGDHVLVELGVEGRPIPRRRLYSPAALNLCGGAPLPSGPPATGHGPAATQGGGGDD